MADGDIGKIYSKLDDHDHRITALESTRPYLQDLIERNINSNEKLSDTMVKIQESMVHLNDKMDKQATDMQTMRSDLERANKATNDKLTTVEAKVSTLEDAGKFDIWAWVKTNWPWMCALCGLGLMYASQYVKF